MVILVPMEPAEFDAYATNLIERYAAEHVKGGRWTAAEAPAEARKEIDQLLPQGIATPHHYLMSILHGPDRERVGVIWLAIEPRGGFIYDLEIFERHRRRGYAEEAMRQVERVARGHGAEKLRLHVFGDNDRARRLYAKLGYVETNVAMAKTLSP
jgi:ribosomal protein S18 acetylase RimI-like enzyme